MNLIIKKKKKLVHLVIMCLSRSRSRFQIDVKKKYPGEQLQLCNIDLTLEAGHQGDNSINEMSFILVFKNVSLKRLNDIQSCCQPII